MKKLILVLIIIATSVVLITAPPSDSGERDAKVLWSDQYRECVKKCRSLCSNSDRPAYCFDQCMRPCTD